MALDIYHLPPGTAQAKWDIFEQALAGLAGPDYSKIYYLAPTRMLLERWQRDFHSFAGEAFIPAVAASPQALAMRLYYDHALGTTTARELIPIIVSRLTGHSLGYASLISDFISECKQQYPGMTPEDIREELLRAAMEAGVHDAVSARITEAVNTFIQYQEALAAQGTADPDDVMFKATDTVQGLDIDLLILDGFYEVTPLEEAFLSALMETTTRTVITVPISSKNDDLSYCYTNKLAERLDIRPRLVATEPASEPSAYHAASSMEDEVETIARQIKSNYISGTWRELDEVLVVFPSLVPYAEMVTRVFKRYGIPLNLTAQRSLIQTRPYQDLLALLECIVDDFPRLPFTRVLTSPYFRAIPEEVRRIAPSITLNAGLVKGRSAWLQAFRQHGLTVKIAPFMKNIRSDLININSASYRLLSKALLDIMKSLKFVPSDDHGLSEVEDILGTLGMLDRFTDSEVTLPEYTDALRRILTTRKAPGKAYGVQVASLFDVRGLEPKVLYIGGLKDGDIPSLPAMDYLLPDQLRKTLGFNDIDRHMTLEERIFRRLSRSARSLHLSYPSMEGDKFYLPSVFITGAKEQPVNISAVLCEQESQLKKGARSGLPLASRIEEVRGIKRYNADTSLRTTDIDAYRSCPRRFFLEKVLSLEPSDLKEYEIEPRELGIVIHEVMERLITPELGALDAFQSRAADILNEVLSSAPLDEYLSSLVRETFLSLVPEIYELEEKIREEGFVFSRAELSLDAEPLPGIRLRGKIDRLDTAAGNKAEVIDYKTGALDLTGSRVLSKGENLQLFLYAAMLKAQGLSPERVGIYSLKDVRLKWAPSVVDTRKGVSLNDLITAALGYLESTVTAMRAGDFPAHPLNDQRCRSCHERPYCPYIQQGERS